MSSPDEFSAEVARAELKLVEEQTPRVLAGVLVLDAFLVWLLSGVHLLGAGLCWAGASAVLQAVRWYAVHSAFHAKAGHVAAVRRLTVLFALLGWLRAAIIPALFAQPLSGVHYVFTMVLLGQMAGAAGSLGGLLRSYLHWGAPIIGCLAGGWWLQHTFEGRWVAVLLLLLFAVLAQNVRANGNTLRQLVRLAQEHREMARSKTRFFASANHDLRQPLHALAINATTLELVARRQADPMIRDLSRTINRALQQSNSLLDALLDLSQLDADAVPVQRELVDLVQLSAGVVDDFRPAAAQRQLELTLQAPDAPLCALTDRRLLLRMLNNLVSNAVKFTERGRVGLVVRAEGASLLVEVRDTGPGIAPQEQERVFEEFYQVGNKARNRAQGLGLGLAIVRRAADKLDVRLQLASVPGEGTVVSVRLPLARSGLPATKQAAADEPQAAALHAKVLAIDDDEQVLESVRGLLSAMGCEVRGALSMPQALAMLGEGFVPDVLLVDHRLPDLTGGEAIAQLRARLGPVPALLITGDAALAHSPAGASGVRVLHKPLDGWTLARELRAALVGKGVALDRA